MMIIVCIAQLYVKVSILHLSQSIKNAIAMVWNLFLESQKKTAIELMKKWHSFPEAQE
jgi:hypothetical protein